MAKVEEAKIIGKEMMKEALATYRLAVERRAIRHVTERSRQID